MSTLNIENNVLLKPSGKAKTIRILVVSLFVFLELIHLIKVNIVGFEGYELSQEAYYKVFNIIMGIFWIFPFMCMSLIASNKVVGISVILISLIEALTNFIYAFNMINNSEVYLFLQVVAYLILMYIVSCIVSNGYITDKTKTWFNMYILTACPFIINMIMVQIINHMAEGVNLSGDRQLQNIFYSSIYQLFFGYELYYKWFLRIFELVIFYKICCSEAFSGNYYRIEKATYNPFNKYTLGALFAIAVTCVLIYWIFINREGILSLI